MALWINLLIAAWMHPFFVSMTDVNYNAKSRSMEVSVRIFTDDFEKTLRSKCHCKVDLSEPAMKAPMGPLVQEYIGKHLQIAFNGKPVELRYRGFQKEAESTWAYFEVANIPANGKLSVSNTLLHDYNEGQINMVHLHWGNIDQTDKLDYPAALIDYKL